MRRTNKLLYVVLTFVLATIFGLTPLLASATVLQATAAPHKVKSHAMRNGVIAGVAAYEVAKKTGKNRKLHGQKLNFAQRHPMMTGIAAYGVAHHYSKKHAKKVAAGHG